MRHLWNARKRRSLVDIRSGDFYDQQDGMVTIQYPQESIPIPDNGRYRLHNEMDDCIVCDKCVKVCPVDCIEIEPIKAIEEVGRASDGSPIRLYAAKFDIDMAKCCYCGLCTTVCPTECLTMTKTFDYSEFDVRDMVYNYSNLTPEQADEKRQLLEQFQKEKEALKAASKPAPAAEPVTSAPAARPVFKPKNPAAPVSKEDTNLKSEIPEEVPTPKPAFRPILKPKVASEENDADKPASGIPPVTEAPEVAPVRPKPVFKPMMKPKVVSDESGEKPAIEPSTEAPVVAKPAFKPTMKPKVISDESAEKPAAEPLAEAPVVAKPAFKPTMKPKAVSEESTDKPAAELPSEKPAPAKPAFKPTMKPKPKE